MKISWIPQNLVSYQGHLGLTHLPGGYRRSRDVELSELSQDNVTHLVCLVQAHELLMMEPAETVEDRRRAVESHDIDFHYQPIEDFQAPDPQQAIQTIEYINKSLQQGGRVVLHCWAGLGRAGTIAACFLTSHGFSLEDAIQTVRWVRPGAIQSQSQEAFIELFTQDTSHQELPD